MSDPDTTPTYPALLKLEEDQRRCVEKFRSGFEKEADMLDWALELIAVSFGYTSNTLLREFRTSENVRLSLVTTLKNPKNPLSQQHRRSVRHRIEEVFLNPFFQLAYKDLRTNANEYVDPESRPSPSMVDEDEDEDDLPIALRPSLQGLHARQKEVLDELLCGFDTSVEIVDWARSLNAASHGELPKRIIRGLTTREQTLRDCLLGNRGKKESEMVKKMFAAQVVLPAFNNGVRTITGAAGERSTLEDDPNDGLAEELGA